MNKKYMSRKKIKSLHMKDVFTYVYLRKKKRRLETMLKMLLQQDPMNQIAKASEIAT